VGDLEGVGWLPAGKTNPRPRKVGAVILHTVYGKRGPTLPGAGPLGARGWTRANLRTVGHAAIASWDFTVDRAGVVYQQNDPTQRYTWHAGGVNAYTVGIEMVQTEKGEIYEATLNATGLLVEVLCQHYQIQPWIPWVGSEPVVGVLDRLTGAVRPPGVFGHRNQTVQRGPGDPGDAIFHTLKARGFRGVDYARSEDECIVKAAQARLGVARDGDFGGLSKAAAVAAGWAHGWIPAEVAPIP